MTDMTEPETLGEVAYTAFGELLAGENVTFGCGLPFDGLPPEVQDGFEKAGSALIWTPAAAAWNDPAATEEAPSTVTVALPDGRSHQYAATDYAFDGDGVHVLAAKNDPSSVFASYAHGSFEHVEINGHRAPDGPSPRPERAQALERLLSSVRAALFASDLTDGERVAAIKAAHDRLTAAAATS